MSIRGTLLFVLIVSFSSTTIYGNDSFVLAGSVAYKSGTSGFCNGDPIAYIIRQHPSLLTHKQDMVLRHGAKKSTQYSLQGCVNCHAVEKADKSGYYAIDAKGQFCAACHQEIAISLDCFQCHRTTPYNGKSYYQRKQ